MTGASAAPAVTFSQAGGTFVTPFSLQLSAPASAAIYYTINGTVPTQNSLLYQSGISIGGSTQIRARAFVPGLMPGDIQSETFLQLDAGLAATNSNLPAIIIYNFGAGDVQDATDQLANISIYEPQNGVTRPDQCADDGFPRGHSPAWLFHAHQPEAILFGEFLG